MIRIYSSFLACLLLLSSVVGAIGTIELCIGDDHVVVAPTEDHHGIQGCCTHHDGCREVTIQGESHPAVQLHESAPQKTVTAAVCTLPQWEHVGPVTVDDKRPPRVRPPPIGLLLAQITVLRL